MSQQGQLLGLGGLWQAINAVLELAHTGRCEERTLETAIDSILRIDADSPADVFGGVDEVAPGLTLFADHLDGKKRDHHLSRIAASIPASQKNADDPPINADTVRGKLAQLQRLGLLTA